MVIKYHHVPGLASDRDVVIEPVYLGDDPLPFIRLIRPPPELTLYLR